MFVKPYACWSGEFASEEIENGLGRSVAVTSQPELS
jgi:hypothetical protein